MSRSSSKPRSTISAQITAPPSSAASINDVKPTSSPQQGASFFVLPPQLSAERRALYKPVKESSLLPKIDEIIGEHTEKSILWYFARYKGGIAHRVRICLYAAFIGHLNAYIQYSTWEKASRVCFRLSSKPIVRNTPWILQNFTKSPLLTETKKEAQDPKVRFDPSGDGIHPLDRVVIKLTIPSRSTSSLSTLTDTSDDGAYEDDDSMSAEHPSRRSARNHKASQQLPFSPRKTRRVVLTVTDDDEEGPSGRRTRGLRQLKLKPTYMDDDYGESEVDSDDDETYGYRSSRSKKGKQKVVAKARGARPEYGTVRPIEDIDLDYFSDDEDRSLRAHRGICEKCHQEPAHAQLAAWKKKKGRKKKKTDNDEDTDDEERIERLGGWVRWFVYFLPRV